MNRFFLLTVLLLFFFSETEAQLYTEKKSQHRFAQSYLGLNTHITPSGGKVFYDGDRGIREAKFPSFVVPRLNIGGLHFWGHLDFTMNFPLHLASVKNLDADNKLFMSPGSDLAARFYPWAVKYGALRPFVGVGGSFMSMRLSRAENDDYMRQDAFVRLTPSAGLSFAFKGWQLNAEAVFMPANRKEFYITPTAARTVELPQAAFSVGIVRYFDVTLREEKPMENGRTRALEKELAEKGHLNSISVAVGPSGSFFTKAPKFSSHSRKSLPRHKGTVNLDWGLGYLLHKQKMHIGLSYRDYSSTSYSYGLEHIMRRRSVALEVYKFLLDYNGFVPYIGASLSRERWGAAEFSNDAQIGETQSSDLLSLGFILGWDILASPLETWVLRTNIRYYPFQSVNDAAGRNSRVDQFEFNFIQVVIYPQRMFRFAKLNRHG